LGLESSSHSIAGKRVGLVEKEEGRSTELLTIPLPDSRNSLTLSLRQQMARVPGNQCLFVTCIAHGSMMLGMPFRSPSSPTSGCLGSALSLGISAFPCGSPVLAARGSHRFSHLGRKVRCDGRHHISAATTQLTDFGIATTTTVVLASDLGLPVSHPASTASSCSCRSQADQRFGNRGTLANFGVGWWFGLAGDKFRSQQVWLLSSSASPIGLRD
jgi:hypothetical protein